MLDYWNIASLEEFAELAASGFIRNRQECDLRFGRMAPLVTEAASAGAPLAVSVCTQAAMELAEGVRLLGTGFSSPGVNVTCFGSVICHPVIHRALASELELPAGKAYRVVEPALSSTAGAVVIAMKQIEAETPAQFIRRLKQHPAAAPPARTADG